jgi:hypothetical protein
VTTCCGDYHYADCPLRSPAEYDESYDDPDLYYYQDDYEDDDDDDTNQG